MTDAALSVLQLVRYFEKKAKTWVKKIHTDGETELKKALTDLDKTGVEVSLTAVYTSEYNGLVERAYRNIVSNSDMY